MSLAKPRSGLGRGLGDLIHRTDPALEPQRSEPLAVEPPEGSYYAELPIGSIRPNPKQPRQVFDEDALAELGESVREVGLLGSQPVEKTFLVGGADAVEVGADDSLQEILHAMLSPILRAPACVTVKN